MRWGGRGTYDRRVVWIVLLCGFAFHYMYMFSDYNLFVLDDTESELSLRDRSRWVEDRHAAQCTDDVQKMTHAAVSEPIITGQNIKRIMWFDMVHNGHGLRNRANMVNFNKCPKHQNCEFKMFLVPDADAPNTCVYGPFAVDAIVFQAVHLAKLTPPKRLSNSQAWVIAERETWWYNAADLRMTYPAGWKDFYTARFDGSFNWTMSFRRDSDIPMLYGRIRPVPETRTRAFVEEYGEYPFIRRDRGNATYDQIFKRKNKTALWLVSDCSTKGKRELYVKGLSKYMDVDIVGKCGRNICPRASKGKIENEDSGHCLSEMIKQYRYVLSFENTFYKDYITEKLFDWFGRDIVQVVYGLTNYSEITPPNSIVNAADFNSPAELAKYLNDLGADRERYTSMLKVKSQYYAQSHPQMQQDAYCNLCDKLNNIDDNRRTYPNIGKWWQMNDSVWSVALYKQALRVSREEAVTIEYIFQLKIALLIVIFSLVLVCCNVNYHWLLEVMRSYLPVRHGLKTTTSIS